MKTTIELSMSLLRVEKKLDEILRLMKNSIEGPVILNQLGYKSQVCPLCNKAITYYLVGESVNRMCGCTLNADNIQQEATDEV